MYYTCPYIHVTMLSSSYGMPSPQPLVSAFAVIIDAWRKRAVLMINYTNLNISCHLCHGGAEPNNIITMWPIAPTVVAVSMRFIVVIFSPQEHSIYAAIKLLHSLLIHHKVVCVFSCSGSSVVLTFIIIACSQ